MISKEKVRKRAVETRDSIDEESRQQKSEEIAKKILEADWFKEADIVLSYHEDPEFSFETVKEEQKKVLMIMPGTAYDARGYRMGYGGGYYDRYLNAHEAEWKMIDFMTVFAAFSEQKMILIPGERCDVKPDVIVTEKEIMQRK